jgi:Spy/CpxP family protein refolding chaperone
MKSKLVLSLVACGASLVVCQGLHAQDASPAPSAASTDTGGGKGGGRHGGGFNADAMLQRLTTQLTLTSDQQTQIKPILDTEFTAIQTVRADTTLARTDRMTKMKDARDTANTAINAILTPDQQTKFAAMQAQMKNRRRGGGGYGGNGGGGAGSGTDGSAAPSPVVSGS